MREGWRTGGQKSSCRSTTMSAGLNGDGSMLVLMCSDICVMRARYFVVYWSDLYLVGS